MEIKKRCPVCGNGFKIVRDHFTNRGVVCLRGHQFTHCNACGQLVPGLNISTHCQLCGAIYELEKPIGPTPGIKMKNPLGQMHKKSFR